MNIYYENPENVIHLPLIFRNCAVAIRAVFEYSNNMYSNCIFENNIIKRTYLGVNGYLNNLCNEVNILN